MTNFHYLSKIIILADFTICFYFLIKYVPRRYAKVRVIIFPAGLYSGFFFFYHIVKLLLEVPEDAD